MANGTKRKSRADTQQGRGEIRPESAWDQFRRWFDTEIGPLKSIQNLVDPSSGSVFEPKTERVARDIYRALIPTTPRGIAAEAVGGAVAGPVIGAGMRRAGRALDVPFSHSRRAFGRDLGGGDLLRVIRERDALTGNAPNLPNWTGKTPHWTDTVAHDIGNYDYPSPPWHQKGLWDEFVDETEQTMSNMIDKGVPEFGPHSMATDLYTKEFDRRVTGLQNKLKESASTLPKHAGTLEEYFNVLNKRIKDETLKETGEELLEGSEGEITEKTLDSILRRLGVR
jgi:hypothetical protein